MAKQKQEIQFALWLFENHWTLSNVDPKNNRYEFVSISYDLFTDINCEHPKKVYKDIEQLYEDYIEELNGKA